MIVSAVRGLFLGHTDPSSIAASGEILEKATRVMTPEEKELMNTDFVGKNGERRRLEVRPFAPL